MKKPGQDQFQAVQFARMTGVTVRALHHYDRMGLLQPAGRAANGYRLYRREDVARLQQIITLKFIGFPLREIKRLLNGGDLATALRLQRRTLEEKRRHLGEAIEAIGEAERVLASSRARSWKTFAKVIEVIQMQTDKDWTKHYYNEEAQKLVEERKTLWSPELQKEVEQQWTSLLNDIEAAAHGEVDPASLRGRELAERHARLIEGFTGGHAAIREGLDKLWADQENWPEEFKKQVFEPFAKQGIASARGPAPRLLSERADAFLKKAVEARDKAA